MFGRFDYLTTVFEIRLHLQSGGAGKVHLGNPVLEALGPNAIINCRLSQKRTDLSMPPFRKNDYTKTKVAYVKFSKLFSLR